MPDLYHVTNRGAGRRDLFRCPVDFLVFLAITAFCFVEEGVRVHAYALMTNHFHLVIEDPRGTVSRAMARLESAYARYFNNSAGRRGEGHLFGDRFFAETVTSARHYDELVSYVLLNPVRTEEPLAADAESYPWSSLALHLEERPAASFFTGLVERFGGLAALLAGMHKASRPEYELTRIARFKALLGGAWIDRDAARCGRTPEQMRQVLRERAGMALPVADKVASESRCEEREAASEIPEAQSVRVDDAVTHWPNEATAERGPGRAEARRERKGRSTLGLTIEQAPRVTVAHSGRSIAESIEVVRGESWSTIPQEHMSAQDVVSYALWRFAGEDLWRIAQALGRTADEVESAIERVRDARRQRLPWAGLLRTLEWRLLHRLGAAPWRI